MTTVKKVKSSRQRDLILRILRSTQTHPTADWIYQRARAEIPHISLGTVYRNLIVLKENGRIQELSYGKGTARYDADLRDHYHVQCMDCGKVEDLPHELPRASVSEVEKTTGYTIYGHRLEFTGYCPHCQYRQWVSEDYSQRKEE